MKITSTTSVQWRKSSYSGGSSGQCVEVARTATLLSIRDSKNPHSGHLAIDRTAFTVLVSRAKAGNLDL
ncbi:DUF397 domain-containing protein [Actinomadura terrae]|uniref:DUF397 domain-containing protein n=1 Tax=Actinomadura terrae TaxID=604353 RepID=UPI0027E1C643|nr:DUF397 domain-containing protein [Actinomadura terrae]